MNNGPLFIPDCGDYYEEKEDKWDFAEGNIPFYSIGKYIYKASNKENAMKLATIRKKIDILCKNIINGRSKWENTTANPQYIDGVNVFLGLHKEFYYDPHTLPSPFFEISQQGMPTSRYLLSEIPKDTKFAGLNKPKMRYSEKNLPRVGKDGDGRALYRDIFLDLNRNEKSLKSLIIHELSHSLANHIAYRPDDHHSDFKWAEKLIGEYWPYGSLF
jgi:hypothetical protein